MRTRATARRVTPPAVLGGLKTFVILAAAVAFAVVAALQAMPSPTVVGAQSADDDLPIFDAHIHYNRDAWGLYSVDDVLSLLDQAGVSRAFVSSTPDEGTRMLYERAPDRIVPSLRLYRTEQDQITWTHDGSILPYLSEQLADNVPYRGIGELHLLPGQANGEIPRGVVSVAADQRMIIHAHAEAAALEELLAIRPDVVVLWAHAGVTDPPSTVARVLAQHSNVWVELALRTDVAPGGQLDPAWAALFAQFPDRFMIGTDSWIPSQWTRLPQLMRDVRVWLRQLPPDLATAIAHTNAEQLLAPH